MHSFGTALVIVRSVDNELETIDLSPAELDQLWRAGVTMTRKRVLMGLQCPLDAYLGCQRRVTTIVRLSNDVVTRRMTTVKR